MKYHGFLLAICLVISISLSLVGSAPQTGNFEFQNDQVQIKVTGNGNVPSYFVTFLGNGEQFKLSFDSVFTADDKNGDGAYQKNDDSIIKSKDGGFSKSLPSSSWEFTGPEKDPNDGIHFNITSVDLGQTNSGGKNSVTPYEDAKIQIRNHVWSPQSASLKFDLLFDGFDFGSTPERTLLVMQYQMQGNEFSINSADNQILIGTSGYFSYLPTATNNIGGVVNVGMSYILKANQLTVYLAYPRFSGQLVHDPTVGVQTSTTTSDDSPAQKDKESTTDSTSTLTSGSPSQSSSTSETPQSPEVKTLGPRLGSETSDAPLSSYFVLIALIIVPVVRKKIRA